jgi:Ran-binding protein 1
MYSIINFQIAHETNEEKEEAAKDVSFEPILNVKKTEAPTGEENEDTLLSVRAKLYRFDKEVNTFKERGIGDLKFLQNKESGRVRIVMRRDKILKVCANHYLTSDMKLEPLKTSKWSWLWATAADYSDNEPLGEVFAVRLRGEEDSNKFVKLFEKYTKLSQ